MFGTCHDCGSTCVRLFGIDTMGTAFCLDCIVRAVAPVSLHKPRHRASVMEGTTLDVV